MTKTAQNSARQPDPGGGKVALITGGAKRIGRAIALALARQGWDIAIHYGQSEAQAHATCAEIAALGRRAHAVQCDLADESAVKRLLGQAQEQLGAVSCVINNASLFDYDSAADLTQHTLDRHMHVNLAAPILLAQALFDAIPEGGQGVVVNLLDQKLYNLNPDFLSYTLSKAALHSATTMLAQALAPKIRVVGVAPGLTMISHIQSEAQFHATHAMSPLGQSSQPDDVADAVVFAATNRALTGSTILIDAGQHMLPLPRDFSLMQRNL